MADGPPKVESTTPREWIDQSIKKHNEYRALHGAEPLVYNEILCQISQAYANHIAETHNVVHNPALGKAKLGENLFFNSNTNDLPVDPDVPVTAWFEEIRDYDFTTGYAFDEGKEILHFTQLVWKKTKEVGIALAKSIKPDGMHANYVVANYSPRGNFDDFLTNVLPDPAYVRPEPKAEVKANVAGAQTENGDAAALAEQALLDAMMAEMGTGVECEEEEEDGEEEVGEEEGGEEDDEDGEIVQEGEDGEYE